MAQISMTWLEFKRLTCEHFDIPPEDVLLEYQLSDQKCSWVSLTCESNWNTAKKILEERMKKVWTLLVMMELANVVSYGDS